MSTRWTRQMQFRVCQKCDRRVLGECPGGRKFWCDNDMHHPYRKLGLYAERSMPIVAASQLVWLAMTPARYILAAIYLLTLGYYFVRCWRASRPSLAVQRLRHEVEYRDEMNKGRLMRRAEARAPLGDIGGLSLAEDGGELSLVSEGGLSLEDEGGK